MRPIAPRIPGLEEVAIAEEQHEYLPITGAVLQGPLGPEMVTRWTFTADERQAIAAGEDLYLRHLTFGGRLQPIGPSIGWKP